MTEPAVRGRRILVTGGLGFVGSHLVDALAPENEVRILDDRSSGTLAHVPESATVIEGDVGDRATLERATHGVDLIFHEAAVVSVERSVEAPLETNRTNLAASLALLECARREDARVVVASSAAIYGHPAEVPVRETTPAAPTSPYGVQKLALDQYARLYHDLYGLETVALRYFNVYGPRQQGPYSGVISTFLEQARAGEPITIEGDGEQTRDFVHVADVVRANLLAATTDRVGEAYNVGTGRRLTIESLAETVRDATGSSSAVVHREPRPGDVRHSVADLSKSRRALGFDSQVELEEGLADLAGRAGEASADGVLERADRPSADG
ncbi:NAD-dependent epimerase/dehydratase family protein [Natronobiforma cellulositropha]|uniref:NAD-dependent epimerase/dehydratase family protein n=1 Tax=Natronobiforma cellulositropha TaxID=1679076 RepID=UPI0021D593AD|nr:NAD-dependent epimerase/dehydratase family protein [Natronobiforma cellulositropha]